MTTSQHPPLEPVPLAFLAVVLGHGVIGGLVWLFLIWWPPAFLQKEEVLEPGRNWFSPTEIFMRKDTSESPAVEPTKKDSPAPAVSKAPAQAPVGPPQPQASPAGGNTPIAGTLEDTPLLAPGAKAAASMKPTSKTITLSPVLEITGVEALLPKAGTPPLTLMDMLKQEKRAEAEKAAAGGADMDPVLDALENALKAGWEAPPVHEVPPLQRNALMTLSIAKNGEIIENRMVKPSGSELLDKSVLKVVESVKKISDSLPSSFPKDRYTVEVNFHIE